MQAAGSKVLKREAEMAGADKTKEGGREEIWNRFFEGGREVWREGVREGGMAGWREGHREGGKEGEREGGISCFIR